MIFYKKKSIWKKIRQRFSGIKFPSVAIFSFFKITFFLCFSILILIYFLYLFYLPKFITEDRFETILNSFISQQTDLILDINNLKISPNYKFDINLKADEIKLNHPNNKNFINLSGVDVDIDLIALFFKNIKINKIKTEKIVVNSNFTKNHQHTCFKYLDALQINESDFNLNEINVLSNQILINLYDENVKKNYFLKTSKTKILFSPKKPIIIETAGFISQKEKIIDFNLKFQFKPSPQFIADLKTRLKSLNYNPFIYADKYNFYTKSDIDLKILPKNNKMNVDGFINFSDIQFNLDNIKMPKNAMLVKFKGEKLSADFDFNLIKNQFIKAFLSLNYSKNKQIELKLNSTEIDLTDLKKILEAISKILNLKLNLNKITLYGSMSADVYLKSNFKTLVSSGSASISNAKIRDISTNLEIYDINSNINFENNKINILNSSGFISSAKFYLKGAIDEKTNLNLDIHSDSVDISKIIALANKITLIHAFLPELKDFEFKNGLININSKIGGNFENPIIQINSKLTNLILFVKPLKTKFSSNEILISANPDKNSIKDVKIVALNNTILQDKIKAKIPKVNLKIQDDDIIFDDFKLNLEGIDFLTKGIIKNYKKDFLAILNISGKLPLKNSLVVIKNKTPELNAQVEVNKDKFFIKNASLKENNKALLSAAGNVDNNSTLENLKVCVLENIFLEIPKYKISLGILGNLSLNGTLKKPDVEADLKLSDLKYQDIYIKNAILNIKNQTYHVTIPYLTLSDIALNSINLDAKLIQNKLEIEKFNAQTFDGLISGSATLDINTFKVHTELILKEINVISLTKYLNNMALAISGRLSAMINADFQGIEPIAIRNSLNSYIKFNINNGELAPFARLEKLLQAGNLVTQRLTINSITSAISKQNTGDFKTIEGTIKIKNNLAQIQYINTQGTNMSLHIEGKYHIISNRAQLKILGRIPTAIAPSAADKLSSTTISKEYLDKIPPLVNQYSPTREFSVMIDGNTMDKSSVKYFNWLY